MTLGFAPISAGPVGSVPAPFSAAGAAQTNVDLTGVSATGTLGDATVNITAGVVLTGLSAQGMIGLVTAGPSTVVGTVALAGVQATGEIGTPLIRAKANVDLVGVEARGVMGIQEHPYTPAVLPTVVLVGVYGTMGPIATPTVQSWEFDAAAANTDLWRPVPAVTGTAQP